MAAVAVSSTTRVAAEEDEYFDLLDEHGEPLGLTELRKVVHAKGLYHRAVYCFVFNSAGQLLLQQRSLAKKVGPGQWDLSTAEHLQPGEAYADAVVRGLCEELGIDTMRSDLEGPLCPVHLRKLIIPEQGIYDYEYVESYELQGYDGPIDFNDEEVTAVKFMELSEIREQMAQAPEQFTVWFREELQAVWGVLGGGAA